MTALLHRMGDPNGNFVRDFQGDGFHSRVFELASFAYLEEAGLAIDRSYERPDFVGVRDGQSVAVEAVTANPPGQQGADISLGQMTPLSQPEIFEQIRCEVSSRIGTSLKRKLRHRYHELPHCAGKPLVLMIAPFFEAGSVFYPDDALFHPLFGGPEGSDDELFPFFQREEAAAISAVLYCNQFTVPRFFRLATDFTAKDAPTAIREGVCYRRHGDDDHALYEFRHQVGASETPRETWTEGVTVFENPNATTPLPRGLLSGSCYVSVQEGFVCREVTDFHPVVSFTRIGVPEGSV